MTLSKFVFLLMLSSGLFLTGCFNSADKKDGTSDSSGTTNVQGNKRVATESISVIVDEAILPIATEQVEVFKSSFEDYDVKLIPLPEIEAVNALIQGDAEMAILARELSEQESARFKQRKLNPRIFPIFYDGVVLINNIASPDTSIDINSLTSLLKGEGNGKTIVFDNINSSTVRKVKELTKVDKISARSVKAMKNSKDVVEAVLEDSQTIGIMSYGQYIDCRRQFGEENKIRILSLQSLKDGQPVGYFKPSQTTLATDEYALKSTFYVLNYQPKIGLGTTFSGFLTGDRGQRIVLRAGLLPFKMPGREIIIRD